MVEHVKPVGTPEWYPLPPVERDTGIRAHLFQDDQEKSDLLRKIDDLNKARIAALQELQHIRIDTDPVTFEIRICASANQLKHRIHAAQKALACGFATPVPPKE